MSLVFRLNLIDRAEIFAMSKVLCIKWGFRFFLQFYERALDFLVAGVKPSVVYQSVSGLSLADIRQISPPD